MGLTSLKGSGQGTRRILCTKFYLLFIPTASLSTASSPSSAPPCLRVSVVASAFLYKIQHDQRSVQFVGPADIGFDFVGGFFEVGERDRRGVTRGGRLPAPGRDGRTFRPQHQLRAGG